MKISAIIPTYNRKELLQRAIQSVFTQTHPVDELLIIDDGSTDDTSDYIANLRPVAPVPLRYHFQANSGAAAARNTGVGIAFGDLLCFLDSDDHWSRDKIDIQHRAMQEQPDYLISHTRETWYRDGKRVNQKKKHDPPHGDVFARSLGMCVVGMSTVMVRKELFNRFGGFDPTLICCEDYDLWLRVSCKVPFLLIPQPLTIKDGGREDQLSALHRMGMDRYRIQALCSLLESQVLTMDQYEKARDEVGKKCRIYGNGCIKHGRRQEGEKYLQLADQYTTNREVLS